MSKLADMVQIGRTFGVRDGALRFEYELRRSSGLMSWRMRNAQGWDSWNLKRIAAAASAEDLLRTRREGSPCFFFHNARILGESVRQILGSDNAKTLSDEADRILEGRLPYFGQLWFASSFPPPWFENPVTGQSVSPQQSWTQMRFASPAYGDLKFILEASRFLFIYPLVRAYALTGDERYAQAFWNAIEDWANHNPPMSGPLWICGQECSLRILAWSFGLHGFLHSPTTTDQRAGLLVSMIAAHAWRAAQTLSYSRSQRSNHLISEAVGLWTAGTLFPELREAEVWRNLGSHLLQEAVDDQLTSEGASHQHSFNYQRMILHLLLWTLRLAEIHDSPLPQVIRQRTEAAFDFMRCWVDQTSGLVPNHGSNDGSLLFPLSVGSYRDFRPLLQMGAGVLHRVALAAGPWDESALWFGGKPGAVETNSSPSFSASPESGYFRLGDEKSWGLIRAGRYARRPFQADQLHVDLWWRGVNLARDPGTYLYNGSTPWNNGLARSAVHNTVTLDGRDQMRRAGRFLWLDWAQASGRARCSQNQNWPDFFEGEHNGYRDCGAVHRRRVQWLGETGWVIVDDIEGRGEHRARLHWLVPDLPYEIADEKLQMSQSIGKRKIRWNVSASSPPRFAIVRGGKQVGGENLFSAGKDELSSLGWESPTYGELQPALSLVCECQAQLPLRFVTVILTGEGSRLERNDREGEWFIFHHQAGDYSSDERAIFRVGLAPPRPRKVAAVKDIPAIP